jgi:hypothetical protein
VVITNETRIKDEMDSLNSKLRVSILKYRLISWNFHYLIITVALVIIHPSQHLQAFITVIQDDSDYDFLKDLFRTIIYYLFLGGVYHDSHVNWPEEYKDDKGMVTTSYGYQTLGYVIMFIICLLERIILQWLQDRFGCSEFVCNHLSQLETDIKEIDSEIKQVNHEIKRVEHLKKWVPVKSHSSQHEVQSYSQDSESHKTSSVASIVTDTVTNTLSLQYMEQQVERGISEDLQPEKLNQRIQQVQTVVDEKKRMVKDALIVHYQLMMRKGLKCFMEETIVLLIWTSAIYKMDLQSFFDLLLIVCFIFRRSFNTIRFIMDFMSIFFLIRLVLILSNMYEDLSPMAYPLIFRKNIWRRNE